MRSPEAGHQASSRLPPKVSESLRVMVAFIQSLFIHSKVCIWIHSESGTIVGPLTRGGNKTDKIPSHRKENADCKETHIIKISYKSFRK